MEGNATMDHFDNMMRGRRELRQLRDDRKAAQGSSYDAAGAFGESPEKAVSQRHLRTWGSPFMRAFLRSCGVGRLR